MISDWIISEYEMTVFEGKEIALASAWPTAGCEMRRRADMDWLALCRLM